MIRACIAITATALLAGPALAAEGGGFAIGAAGADLAAAPDQPHVNSRSVEPWVASARVGDFIVRKYAGDRIERWEVKAVDADAVDVVVIAADSGKTLYLDRYALKPGVGSPRDLGAMEMKPGKKTTLTIADREVACVVWEGYRILMQVGMPNGPQSVKLARLVQAVAAEAPFGGVMREAQAPDDGKPLPFSSGPAKAARQFNRIDRPELVFEVIDFGRGKAKADNAAP